MNAVQGGAVTFAATILICYLIGLSCPEPEPVTFTVLTPIQAPPTLTPIPLPQTTQKMETPKVTYTGTNRTPMPNGWTTAYTGMHYGIGGVANNVLDESVLYNDAATLRQDPVGTTDNTAREVNSYYLTITPGDHIYFSVWMKTSASSLGDTDPNSGGRLGVDYYGASGRIGATQSPDGAPSWTPPGTWDADTYLNYVNWDTSEWTQRIMEFTVPATFVADPWCSASYTQGDNVVPVAVIPWFQVYSSTYGASDEGSVWFANPVFYINPSQSGSISIPVLVSALMMQRR